jgi:hypothetical protein
MGRSARVLLSGCFLLFATSAMAQTVKVDWQTTAPFADHRTCAWRPSKNLGAHFCRQWVEKDPDADLAQKGRGRPAS